MAEKKTTKTSSKPKTVGLDVGTMNLVANNGTKTKLMRNVFLPIDKDQANNNVLENISHAVIEDDTIILGQDAFEFCNIFGKKPCRPMKDGLISNSEVDALDVIKVLIQSLTGKGTKGSKCCFSVPGNPIDSNGTNIYHTRVITRILQSLGFEPIAINEAMAAIFSECEESSFSGIGFSFGAGMSNIAVSYKGISAVEFSVARGGDWIDENVANSTGTLQSRVTSIKESGTDLLNWNIGTKNRKEKRVREAILHFYEELIQYAVSNMVQELEKNSDDFDIPEEMPIVITGGTSMPEGFIEIFSEVIKAYEDRLPFEISEIRRSENSSLFTVAQGCFIRASL